MVGVWRIRVVQAESFLSIILITQAVGPTVQTENMSGVSSAYFLIQANHSFF